MKDKQKQCTRSKELSLSLYVVECAKQQYHIILYILGAHKDGTACYPIIITSKLPHEKYWYITRDQPNASYKTKNQSFCHHNR